MKIKQIFKIIVDIVMTLLFIVLMAYHITGNKVHEWLGTMLFLLFIIHHILNLRWYKGLFKGNYTVYRIFVTLINFLLFLSIISMMLSGIFLSREIFAFLNIRTGMFGRKLHMLSTAWGYILIAVHIGLHWGMVIGMIKKAIVKRKRNTIIIQIIIAIISCYGVYSFFVRQIVERMFLLIEYTFLDYKESAAFFFIDYISILILFAAMSYYTSKFLQKRKEVFL